MIFFLFAAEAQAFCGTFVGGDGALLANTESRVVLANDGTHTTLTLAMDYRGDAADFALILPVPEILTAESVSAVDQALITRIDEWSVPREVAYTCEDVVSVSYNVGGCGAVMGCDDSNYTMVGGGTDSAEGSVTVESTFSQAGYTFVVLSAEESSGLQGWLDANGYALPAGGDAILQEYIDSGSYFLAAKVALDAAPTDGQWLPPIQLRYASTSWALPIRIGTISADGPQEVTVFALGNSSQGEVSISNYPEVSVEDECMRPATEDLGAYYADQLDAALVSEAGWVMEYSWDLTANCDPCTAATGLTPDELAALGLDDYHGHLSRMRLRYTAEQATQDVAMYGSGVLGQAEQIRYIQHADVLEGTFPVCGEGFVAEPAGTCLTPDRASVTGIAAVGAAWAPAGLLGGLTLLAALRRRRA